MNLNDALRRIRFWTGTLDDITGQSVNGLFNNQSIVDQLQFALNEYARETKAIEDIYTVPLNINVPRISAPPLALRSETYRYINMLVNGRWFACDIVGHNNVFHNFPYSGIVGIPQWVMPWGSKGNDFLYVFPLKGTSTLTTHITGDISPSATTIPVTTTDGFILNEGRFTLGNEKIVYGRKDATNFYDCQRGQEQTDAVTHNAGDELIENSVYIYYSRLHRNIICINNSIPQEELGTELEIVEEHIETVLKYATYNLLLKVDPNRASVYKLDWMKFLDDAVYEIRKGRARIKKATQIRNPYMSENSQAYSANMY